MSMPRPTIKQADKPHSPHVGSLIMLKSSLARPLLLLSLRMVSRLFSSCVKNKKNWKEENPTLGMLSTLTISFPDNYRLGHSWVGHIYAAMASKLSWPVPSNLHFTHVTKSIVSINVHQHPCGLTSLALPPLGKLPSPSTFHGHFSPSRHCSNEPTINIWGQDAARVTRKYSQCINQLFLQGRWPQLAAPPAAGHFQLLLEWEGQPVGLKQPQTEVSTREF